MSLRIVIALSALAIVTGCADGAGGPADALVGPNAVVGNPPPPAFSGKVMGTFEVSEIDGKVARTQMGLSLERETGSSQTGEPPEGTFRFLVENVEYNADSANLKFWMAFPRQPLPGSLKGRFPNFQRGRITVQNGKSVGTGVIIDIDEKNGGFWLIPMNQFTQPYEVFVPGCQNPNWVNCITLDAPIVAKFFRVIGYDEDGRPIFEGFTSQPSSLAFATGF